MGAKNTRQDEADGIEPAQRSTESTGDRAAQIHDGILVAILEHRLHPGTKLGEDEIGSIYGVSRTIARAALRSLAHQGIIVLEKNRGAFIARPSLTEAVEVFEARKLVEATTAARAAERADAAAARALHAHLEREHEAIERGDEHAAIRLSGDFHMAIARLAGQSTLQTFLGELIARSSLIILLYRRRHAQVCHPHHHVELADAIGRGDSAGAARLMLDHLDEIEAGLDLVERAAPATTLVHILKGS